jgi:heat shock protein HslJ
MMVVRIFGAVCALLAVFLFGMWLTWPELPYNPSGFPIDRKFLALSLNDQPLMLRDAQNIATLEVRGHLTFRHRVGGTSLCNRWGGHITFLPGRRIVWRSVFKTVGACVPKELEERYLQALLGASRWRTQDGELILENGTDILRFRLAPP